VAIGLLLTLRGRECPQAAHGQLRALDSPGGLVSTNGNSVVFPSGSPRASLEHDYGL
jgi:hypothetical protein